MTRRFSSRTAGAAGLALACAPSLLAVTGCSNLLDPPEFSDARIEVDPTIVRTIHYAAVTGKLPDPAEEVTTKRMDEIECLRRAPWCSVSEMIQVTVHNEGTRTLLWYDRDYHL